MEWLANLPPELHNFLIGAAADGTGGLVGGFLADLLRAAGRQVRSQFQTPEQQAALRRAVGAALYAALDEWNLSEEEAGHYRGLFEEWLGSYDVLGEFRLLLAPGEGSEIDIDRLRAEFDATGLSAEHLGKVSFRVLVQDMVAAFYAAASEEQALQEPLQIGLLRQMAERMGALARLEALRERWASLGTRPVDLLAEIRRLAERMATEAVNPATLLEQSFQVLARASEEDLARQQEIYKTIIDALTRANYELDIEQLQNLGQERTGLPPELLQRLRTELAACEVFASDGALRHLFIDERIHPWHDTLPHYDTPAARVIGVIHDLYRQESATGENALVLLLRVLSDAAPAGTARRQSLAALADAVEHGVPAGSLRSAGIDVEGLTEALSGALLAEIRERLQVEKPLSSADLTDLETLYRKTIIDQFEKLTFKGIAPSGTPISLPLEDVYVELRAVADVPDAADSYSAEERRLLLETEGQGEHAHEELSLHLDALRAERWNRDARREATRFQRRSIQETLSDSTQRGIVILGDPGSGKTTLLHYLALLAASREGATPDVLPIFVPLAAYDEHLRRPHKRRALGDFLALYYDEWLSLPGLAPLFQQALAEGRALLLLDGLDEVLDTAARQFVAEQVGALLRQWSGRGSRFALTSRIVGYREARVPGDLSHVTVLDFGPAEIELFARQWCRSYEIWLAGGESPTALQRAATEQKELLDDVRSNPSVERLAASPLLLTMLALLRRHVGKLPDRRVELYQSYVRTLIDNWELSRSPGARLIAPERFDPHTAIAHLIELAFWLQQNKPSGTARREELEQVLAEICIRFEGHDPSRAAPRARVAAQQDAERFLKDMRHFAGLLAERGRDTFGFLHLTFQEYFAGRALARMEPDERWGYIALHLHHPRWREPILLCAGQLGVIEQRRDQASDLARRILHAGSEREEILHRDLFLAAALAADNVGLSSAILDEIAARLIPLQNSPIPTVRDNALAGLAQLARQEHPAAQNALLESLQNETLQLLVLEALKPVFVPQGCVPLQQAVETLLRDEDEDVRIAALRALAPLVGTDTSVRQTVETWLGDKSWSVRVAAVRALAPLAEIDAEAREFVVAWMADNNHSVRATAVAALASLVESDARVRQVVEARLSDKDENVRMAALGALASLVGSDTRVRQAIEARLSDESSDVRAVAVRALASLVGSDISAHETVEAQLSDEDSEVRAEVVQALARLMGSDMAARQAVEAQLDDTGQDFFGRPIVALRAIQALAGLMGSDTAARQTIAERLSHESWQVRAEAIRASGEVLRNDVGIRLAIEQRLADESAGVRVAAVQALAGLVGSNTGVRQAVERKLDDTLWNKASTRTAFMQVLARLGESDAEARQAVGQRLADEAFSVRMAAVRALAGLVGSDATLRQAVVRRLADANSEVRVEAVRALAPLMGSDEGVRRAVEARLSDEDLAVRMAVVRALAGIVESDAGARQKVETLLFDLHDKVRMEAVWALAPLVGSDATAFRAIEELLADESRWVRMEAIRVLSPLVENDARARRAVEATLTDEWWRVRAAVVRALAPLVENDTRARQAVEARLADEVSDVQAEAARALAGLVRSDAEARRVLEARLVGAEVPVLQEVVRAMAALVGSDIGVRQTMERWMTHRQPWLQVEAMRALAGVLESDEGVRQAVEERLADNWYEVRVEAVRLLTGLVGSHGGVRQAVEGRLVDEQPYVRKAAVQALAGLVGSDAAARQSVEARLADSWGEVRVEAMRTLLSLIPEDVELRHRLLTWLGAVIGWGRGRDVDDTGEEIRRAVADAYAPLLAEDEALLVQVVAMLNSIAWTARQGAAWAIIAMPGGPPPHLLPKLRDLLDDMRGEESWPERLQVAELFINDRDHDLSQRAIATALAALDYATQPWYDLPYEGSQVRQQAARILGQLEPLYRDEAIFARLARVLDEDESDEVRDAAYGALLRLAAAPERMEG